MVYGLHHENGLWPAPRSPLDDTRARVLRAARRGTGKEMRIPRRCACFRVGLGGRITAAVVTARRGHVTLDGGQVWDWNLSIFGGNIDTYLGEVRGACRSPVGPATEGLIPPHGPTGGFVGQAGLATRG